jgi:hypothetical protein
VCEGRVPLVTASRADEASDAPIGYPPESFGPCRAFGVAGALRFAKRAHALGPLRLAYGEPEARIALAWNFSS